MRQRPTYDAERQRLPAIGKGSSSSPHPGIDARRVSTATPRGGKCAPLVRFAEAGQWRI